MLDRLPPSLFLDVIFPLFTDTLDYQTCGRLAQTCTYLANTWTDYAVRDVCHRTSRFYTGAALRSSVSVLRTVSTFNHALLRDPGATLAQLTRLPPLSHRATLAECVSETVYCGLPITTDELHFLQRIDIAIPLEELKQVSHVHLRQPHTIPSTRARSLICSGDTVIEQWRTIIDDANDSFVLTGTRPDNTPIHENVIQEVYHRALVDSPFLWTRTSDETLFHGPRITTACAVVLAALRGANYEGPALLANVVKDAAMGALYTLPLIVHAYHRTFGPPRMPLAFVTRNPSELTALMATPKTRLRVAAFLIFYALTQTFFGLRVRSRKYGRSGLGRPSRLPALVDASNSWKFTVYNGYHSLSPILDTILYADLYAQDTNNGGMLRCELLTSYRQTRVYLDDHPVLSPVNYPRYSMRLGDEAWLQTVLPREFSTGLQWLRGIALEAIREVRRRGFSKAGHVIYANEVEFGLPPLYVGISGEHLFLSCIRWNLRIDRMNTSPKRLKETASPYNVLLAEVSRRAIDGAFVINWSPTTLQLPTDSNVNLGLYRCRILKLLQKITTTRIMKAPRCSSCNKYLTDPTSILHGKGAECRKREIASMNENNNVQSHKIMKYLFQSQ